jgi:hypothetical protein
MRGISRVAENRLASQEGLCSMELVSTVAREKSQTLNSVFVVVVVVVQ